MLNAEIYHRIVAISKADRRYKPQAYQFMIDALDHTITKLHRHTRPGQDKHISGQELLEGVRDYALCEYGPLARVVFESWGVRRTEDFGEIVFNLVEHHLLNKRETDTKDDFRDGYDFEKAFEKDYEIPISWDLIND
jgi:uncharacterized repeat protein (TIGR04138 family)